MATETHPLLMTLQLDCRRLLRLLNQSNMSSTITEDITKKMPRREIFIHSLQWSKTRCISSWSYQTRRKGPKLFACSRLWSIFRWVPYDFFHLIWFILDMTFLVQNVLFLPSDVLTCVYDFQHNIHYSIVSGNDSGRFVLLTRDGVSSLHFVHHQHRPGSHELVLASRVIHQVPSHPAEAPLRLALKIDVVQ